MLATALGRDTDRRKICQFDQRGFIPSAAHASDQVMVHALQAVLESGSGRDINRHKYGVEEAEKALEQPVVRALLDLC